MPKKEPDLNELRTQLEAVSPTRRKKERDALPLPPPAHCTELPRGPPRLQRVVRKFALPAFVGLKRTQIDELIKNDRSFPKPIKLSQRAIAWLEDELIDWQQARIAARDKKLQQRE
jgi:prophage regulatory protein